ncbi:hypothetical protein HanRHA438_Chr08g0333211 [Helianthus annuus]|nr:hypothetical protein HanRHA438_Chr08g0333211 [Helianthus annuus]
MRIRTINAATKISINSNGRKPVLLPSVGPTRNRRWCRGPDALSPETKEKNNRLNTATRRFILLMG